MGLADRLESYEVTAVPAATGDLRLVWSAPDDGPDTGADSTTASADGADGADAAVTRLLSAYRITRVPARHAS